ncbi:DUF3800 domain-containing protein [Subtercola endophyticus]|uniref:DUF3800 domain-containing protein n=1 Tax=Subtercola endophyticus TaxID=2895559 RepID=UPI001E44EA93|nr:hypothetical protein [Subtercola endophyticus]UFS58064.1 hypothetical protein LQ955_13710 [Subtercola endophyticus]
MSEQRSDKVDLPRAPVERPDQERCHDVTVLFLDESKGSSYFIVATQVSEGRCADARKAVARLRKSGQRRVHFVKEGDSRRRLILSQFAQLNLSVTVYRSDEKDELVARERCLAAVARYAVQSHVSRIILERDYSIEKFDRRILFHELTKSRSASHATYGHETSADEPLLWVSDAVAWCVARGGDWRRRVSPLITCSVDVDVDVDEPTSQRGSASTR